MPQVKMHFDDKLMVRCSTCQWNTCKNQDQLVATKKNYHVFDLCIHPLIWVLHVRGWTHVLNTYNTTF